MRETMLSNEFLADFCRELSLLLHAGIGVGDGLYLLAEDEPEKERQKLLHTMADQASEGWPRQRSWKRLASFPATCGP